VTALPFSNPAVPRLQLPRPKCGSCSVAICPGSQ
jgi:hypothetical protein